MSERLSDEFLRQVDEVGSRMMDGEVVHGLADRAIIGAMISSVISELRDRRAADLSAEDVEALAWARGFVSNAVPEHRNPACYPMRALSVLDRIINGGGR